MLLHVHATPMGRDARFCSPSNQNPPFGELETVRLRTDAVVWHKSLDIVEELVKGFCNMGTLNVDGNLTTAAGLAFIGAVMKGYFQYPASKAASTNRSRSILNNTAFTAVPCLVGIDAMLHIARREREDAS